jgi:hypothetical protein
VFWIRIWIIIEFGLLDPDPDPGSQNDPQKKEKG